MSLSGLWACEQLIQYVRLVHKRVHLFNRACCCAGYACNNSSMTLTTHQSIKQLHVIMFFHLNNLNHRL